MSENKTSESSFLITLILGLGLFFVAMNFISSFLVEIWRWLRVVQLSPLAILPEWVPYFGGTKDLVLQLTNLDNSLLTKNVISTVDTHYYPFFGWIYVAIMVWFAKKRIGQDNLVKEKLSMEQILKKYSKSFPFLKPFVDFNPAKMTDMVFDRDDEVKLKFLPALQPVEFATMVPPLHLDKEAEKDSSLMAPIYAHDEGINFDEDLAFKCFQKQLGAHFTCLEDLPEHEKKLYDFFIGKITFNKTTIQKDLIKILKYVLKHKGVFVEKTKFTGSRFSLYKELNEIYLASENKSSGYFLSTKYINKLLMASELEGIYNGITGEDIMNRHAFTYCGFMSMLSEARQGGVIPPIEFQWVKFHDRKLYFALSSVGKQVSFVESAGIFAHWILEEHIQRPIPTAEVSEAVVGLRTALYIDYSIS
ncbi:hypothetical protein L1267_11210 [Pseudoalteromonas sp. OFAV1]|uniref:secretion/conjugation apparatus DotM-related subunit n=1 Tax=Pseudoalteromonas sp. OFAV1 TaxID=2908892 RepID=UPI001F1D77A0|nr:hypothetical protein [Pseudoalteromonas sp. OFAV1]MCF2900973.1 hypothetical protein [Pseudoalteromonas sp. OFAV1]